MVWTKTLGPCFWQAAAVATVCSLVCSFDGRKSQGCRWTVALSSAWPICCMAGPCKIILAGAKKGKPLVVILSSLFDKPSGHGLQPSRGSCPRCSIQWSRATTTVCQLLPNHKSKMTRTIGPFRIPYAQGHDGILTGGPRWNLRVLKNMALRLHLRITGTLWRQTTSHHVSHVCHIHQRDSDDIIPTDFGTKLVTRRSQGSIHQHTYRP